MWPDCAANYLLGILPHIQWMHKEIFMNVGRKRLVRQYLKMSQSALEVSDSDNFIHIKRNTAIWSSTSELRHLRFEKYST